MNKIPNLEEWFADRKTALSIEVEEIAMIDSSDWVVVEQDGQPRHIGHVSGNYHTGVFLRGWDIVRNAWIERFMIAPISAEENQVLYGLALLARYKDRYLIQAKAEPGNNTPGHVLITSTVQASYINIKNKLSGDVPFTEMWDDPKNQKHEICLEGAQFYLKNNSVCFLELTEPPKDIPENYTWMTLEEIGSFVDRALVSEHLIQCLGVSVLPSHA
jgi:hypothetical protein